MKKFHVLGLALAAAFALSAVMAGSASAGFCASGGSAFAEKYATEAACNAMTPETAGAEWYLAPEWLVNGEPVVGEPATETSGELELTDLGAPGGASKIDCSGIFVGVLLAAGHDLVSSVLDLNHVAHGGLEPLEGTPFENCTKLSGACTNEILVWPENLPWLSQLELMEVGGKVLFLDSLTEDSEEPMGKPAWEVECKTLIGKVVDLCEGDTSFDLENMPEAGEEDVLGVANEAELEAEGLRATCTLGGANSGDINTPVGGLIFLTGGGTLAVS